MYSEYSKPLYFTNEINKMKVLLIANVSANGKVLLAENPQHHAPKEAESFFVQQAIQSGNLVLGRKTFEVIEQFFGGVKQALPGVEIVLLSETETTISDFKVVSNPQEAIKHLADKGFNEIAVGGGTKTYNAFLDGDFVTDIYFNFIPIITGYGGVLGTKDELNTKFKLTEHKLLADDIVQLHLTKV
jgi:dihydrofolate reductase